MTSRQHLKELGPEFKACWDEYDKIPITDSHRFHLGDRLDLFAAAGKQPGAATGSSRRQGRNPDPAAALPQVAPQPVPSVAIPPKG